MALTPYEAQVADVSDQVLALYANIVRLTAHGWHADTGANIEGVYNAGGIGANDKPVGEFEQSRMNNAQTALVAIRGIIETHSGKLAMAALLNPGALE
jgi:hypothetical protein